jgi:hypothetical protein
MSKIRSIDSVRSRLVDKFGDLVTYEPMPGDISSTKLKLVDVEFGVFYATLGNVLQKQCHGHPFRSMRVRSEKTKYTNSEITEWALKATDGKVRLSGNYHGMLEKAIWLDEEYGMFEAYPCNVLHKGTRHPDGVANRRRETFMKKHGVDHYLKADGEYRRIQKKLRQKSRVSHWKTGEDVICDSAWEARVIEYLNEKKEDYDWHPRSFTLPSGRVYWPDGYLKERDIWIEVKGRWLGNSREKWDWFHAEHPNSELWDRSKLRELGLATGKVYSN